MSNLIQLIQANPELSIVSEAFLSNSFDEKLSSTDKFTVFAPTNQAILQELSSLNISKEEYFADKKRLEDIIKFHIILGKPIYSKDAKEDLYIETLNGHCLDISKENDIFTVNGVKVISSDIVADNGVLHIIDRVLTSPSV